jgi:hypothetical protein
MFVNGGVHCQRFATRVPDVPAERVLLREHLERRTWPEVVKEALLERPPVSTFQLLIVSPMCPALVAALM